MSGFRTKNNRRLDAKLKQAIEFHQKKNFQQAVETYAQVLQLDANHSDAHYFLGLLLRDLGRFAESLVHFERATALLPARADYCMALADACSSLGQAERALGLYADVVENNPQHAIANFRLAQACERAGNPDGAVKAYRRAVQIQPDFSEALNNLGNACRQAGDIAGAEHAYRRAIGVRADFAEAYRNMGVLCYLDLQDIDRAIDWFLKAIAFKPGFVDAHFSLALAYDAQGRKEEAVATYETVLALKPDHAEAYNNLGMIFFAEGFFEEAKACYERALEIRESAEARNNLGIWWSYNEKFDEAKRQYREAIRINPSFPDAYNGLGMMLSAEGKFQEATSALLKALDFRPAYPEALANLGKAYHEMGDVSQAILWYQKSDAIQPSGALRLRAATALPRIMGDWEAIQASRRQFETSLDRLLDAPPQTPESEFLKYGDTSFYLAYHGMNDKDLQIKLAEAYVAMCPSLDSAVEPSEAVGGRIKIGFLSKFFYNHSVGNSFKKLIAHLSRSGEFEVVLIGLGGKSNSDFLGDARQNVRYIQFSINSLQAVREAVAQEKLDILVYTDIGMDYFTYFLAFSRLARVQCVMPGHPVTTGIPNVDHYISWDCMESPEGEQHYSEHLVRLAWGGSCMDRPEAVSLKSREQLGLSSGAKLYICPHRLQKLHPDFDLALASILENDPMAEVLVFDDNKHKVWKGMIEARFAKSMPAQLYNRIKFLPWAENFVDFMSINAAADVLLDCFHFGAGTTAWATISAGIPMVTLPGQFYRGRCVKGLYSHIGVEDSVASSLEDFVSKAISLAHSADQKASLGERIRKGSEILFNAEPALKEMEEFLIRIAQ